MAEVTERNANQRLFRAQAPAFAGEEEGKDV
jgi:hypothetical protein